MDRDTSAQVTAALDQMRAGLKDMTASTLKMVDAAALGASKLLAVAELAGEAGHVDIAQAAIDGAAEVIDALRPDGA